MTERFTPEQITALEADDVFVFGSNAEGRHLAGAAAYAWRNFGAVWGDGEGLHGQSYAIPTMGTLAETTAAVGRFLLVAKAHPWLTFLVTKIGTSIAGWPVEEIAPLFAERLPNVVLPREFVEALHG